MVLMAELPQSSPTHHLNHLQHRRQLDDMKKETGKMVRAGVSDRLIRG